MSFLLQLAFWKTYISQRGYSLEEMPDQSSRVAIVTGANSGLGFQTAVMLGARGAQVFLACRSPEKGQDAIQRAKVEIARLRKQLKQATSTTKDGEDDGDKWEPKLEYLELDLNDIRKVKASADAFLAKGLPLHILVNNAGIYHAFSKSADGYEQHMAVNHLGHFVFTLALLDRLKQSQPSRIVNISSFLHEAGSHGGIDFNTVNIDKGRTASELYGRSKLMNILFTKALARRLVDTKVYANVINPGTVATELTRSWPKVVGPVIAAIVDVIYRFNACPAEKGVMTQLYAATSPEIEEKDFRGRYFIPTGNELRPRPLALDEELQERLWDYSTKVMNQCLSVPGSEP